MSSNSLAAAKIELIEIARAVLGADAGRIVKKLEAAPDTVQGLGEAALQCKKLVRLTIDENKADVLLERCLAVLGKL